MSWLKRNLGLDWFDVLIQFGVTCMLLIWVDMSHGPEEMFPVITGASLIVLGVRRAIALRSGSRPGLTTGEMEAERIAELEQRVAELEGERGQLEERLDFAERMLSRGRMVPPPIGPGGQG